jgi:hypothetical protein
MKLTADDAFDLSKKFREAAVSLGNYRFDNWDDLTNAQRQGLEDDEWSLFNASSDMITKAVGLALDESEFSLSELQASTTKAKKAIKTLKTVAQVIGLATALVGLAAAIISKDPKAVANNAKLVFEASKA